MTIRVLIADDYKVVADGLSHLLGALSVRTIETYRARLMEKLDIRDVPTLVKFAIRHGLASLE